MTVAELIEKLCGFPGDIKVCVETHDPKFDVQLMMDLEHVALITDSRKNQIALIVMEEI